MVNRWGDSDIGCEKDSHLNTMMAYNSYTCKLFFFFIIFSRGERPRRASPQLSVLLRDGVFCLLSWGNLEA